MQICHNCGFVNWENSDEQIVTPELSDHPQGKNYIPGKVLHKATCYRKQISTKTGTKQELTCGSCHRDIGEITQEGKRFLAKGKKIGRSNNYGKH
ncbi:MAG: hypothetical protein ACW98X_26005 [Promethearchaeota archaeon]|jgi:hypothetical protein